MKIITTSWDDGDVLDFKIAEYLEKYKIKGTFYIPKKISGKQVMSETEIIQLGQNFEIGGHTLNHTDLKKASKEKVAYEVAGCYKWIESLTGVKPISFCLPKGYYTKEVLTAVYATGFKLIRTTNLLYPFESSKLASTTLQVYEHTSFTLFKHLIKNGRYNSLKIWMQGGASNNLLKMLDYYLNYILKYDGCLHIWGHSWEIEQKALWPMLERMLKEISGLRDVQYVENKNLINTNI